jgi:hypothetical protein
MGDGPHRWILGLSAMRARRHPPATRLERTGASTLVCLPLTMRLVGRGGRLWKGFGQAAGVLL